MTVKTDSYVIGSNVDDTRNFLLDTDLAGALRIRRKSDGSGGLLATFDSSGNLQLGSAANANAGRMVLATSQNATSGTTIDFTSIPAWAKRITVFLMEVSTTGTSQLLVQIGSGSVQTTGYASSSAAAITGTSPVVVGSSAGFIMYHDIAADSRSYVMQITAIGSNRYVTSFTAGGTTNRTVFGVGGGSVTLSGICDRVRLTTTSGTDTFDAGFVNLMYEG